MSLRNMPKRLFRILHTRFTEHINRKNLSELAVLYGSDKWGSHFYTQHYQKHFQTLRRKRLNLLEIGVGGYDNPVKGGESLRMWRRFFPKGQIYGLDIYDKSLHDSRRIKTFKGSQCDEEFLRHVVGQIGEVDIVIDDGSHYNEDVIKTFTILFPLIADQGIYVVEDTQTSYWENVMGERWGGSQNPANPATSMNFFKGLIDGLNYEEFTDENYHPTYFDMKITSMHFYHNLVFVYKGSNTEGSNVLKNSPSRTFIQAGSSPEA